MLIWFRLTQEQYFGFFVMGILFLILQELPYIIMPLIHLKSNPLMEMKNKSVILNSLEKILGISCILAMLFLVRYDSQWFSWNTLQEKIFFCLAIAVLTIYFIGWFFYFKEFHNLKFILFTLVAMPPIYYGLIGLWRENYILAILGFLFLLAHLANVSNNMKES